MPDQCRGALRIRASVPSPMPGLLAIRKVVQRVASSPGGSGAFGASCQVSWHNHASNGMRFL